MPRTCPASARAGKRRDWWPLRWGLSRLELACRQAGLLFFRLVLVCYLVLVIWSLRKLRHSPVPGSMFHVPGSVVFFSRPAPLGLRCFFSPVPGSMFHVPGSRFRRFLFPACPVRASLFLLPGPGFHVPCSRFPVPPFSFPAYRPAPLGLFRNIFIHHNYCINNDLLLGVGGGIAGIRQIFPRIFLQIMPLVVRY